MAQAKFESEGGGILSRRRTDGKKVYYVRLEWKGKRYTERAGMSLDEAKKRIADRLRERDKGTYVPPRARKRQERRTDDELMFEKARDRFLDDCLRDYSQPKDVRAMLERLTKAFRGRRLDQITRADVDLYFRQRRNHEGPFARWKRRTGLRSPQREIVQLSQLYRFMQDRGFELANPCLRPVGIGRRAKGKAQTYRPEREPVIPTIEALGAILSATPARFTKQDRALIHLAYYTGGRPASDLLRLCHGDVSLPDEKKVVGLDGKPALGEVRFRDAKTAAGQRIIPLHPGAVEALRAIMEPEPKATKDRKADAIARRTWGALSIFRTTDRKGKVRPWDQHTYRKTWANVVEAASEAHPAIEGMILRDLRKTFRTYLTNARVPEPTIRRLMGHAVDVSQGYHELTPAAAREAILSLPTPTAQPATVTEAVTVSAVNGVNP